MKELLGSTSGCLAADAGFALSDLVLTPYRQSRKVDETHRNFNAVLSSLRVLIENVNGDLKVRVDFLFQHFSYTSHFNVI